MMTMNDKQAISWEEAKAYVKNIYDKMNRGLPLEPYEEQLLLGFPQELIDEVNREEAGKAPLKRLKQLREQEIPVEQAVSPEDYQRLLETSPEAVLLHTFMPEVFNSDILLSASVVSSNLNPAHFVDASINTFAYLKELGYNYGMWMTGPEHSAIGEKRPQDHCSPIIDGIPICDRMDASQIDLEDAIINAINHAHQHGYYPPKPILAYTHPGCSCSVLCWAPTTPEEIPDSAPGIPIFGTPQEILFYKQHMHSKMQDFQIDRWTVLSPEVYEIEAARAGIFNEYSIIQASSDERRKFADWKSDVEPVAVSDGFILRSYLGTYRPIPDTYFGVQIDKNDEYCRVYLGDLGRVIIAPVEKIKKINLKSKKFSEINANMYIKVDDNIGIVIKVFSEDKILCFVPELDGRVFLDSGEIFEKA